MDSRYVRDGRAARDAITMDVRYRRLKRGQIKALANDPMVQKEFFGSLEPLRKPKREWTPEYLRLLTGAAVGECFNLEYLLYLDEVAGYISKTKFRRIVIAGVIVVLVFIAGVLVYTYILRPRQSELPPASNTNQSSLPSDQAALPPPDSNEDQTALPPQGRE